MLTPSRWGAPPSPGLAALSAGPGHLLLFFQMASNKQSPLLLKPAAHYAAAAAKQVATSHTTYREQVVKFLNEVVTPQIERSIAHPEEFTIHGYTVLEIPAGFHPAGKFVADVASILTPLGYEVRQSHDGGGMNDTVVIRWLPSAPKAAKRPLNQARLGLI